MIIIPTSGSLQVPGSLQSFARVFISRDSLGFVNTSATSDNDIVRINPDAGYLVWEYEFQGVQRWGSPLPIAFNEQFIFTDIPHLEITRLMAVLRLGVQASISIRRTSI